MTLDDEIRARCRALGFHRYGIARAIELDLDHDRYRSFVAAGMHGEMDWLAQNPEARRRVDTDAILEGARSVIVCAIAYARSDASEPAGPRGATVARYARGRDYHRFFRERVRKLAAWLRRRVPGSRARPIVDTAPVLERAWAQRAGVGFVGKNGCIIAPGLGSYLVLGEVVTTLDLAPDEPLASRCGQCTRCLDACPTRAFAAPFVLDARRCVSYLTIEQRDAIAPALREGIGNRLFGCDDCQDVCPYNRSDVPPPETTVEFALDPRWRDLDVSDLAQLDEARFASLTRGSPLARPGRAGLVRNAVTVMGNTRDRRHLPILASVRAHDAAPMVREAAQWAIDRIVAATALVAPPEDAEKNTGP